VTTTTAAAIAAVSGTVMTSKAARSDVRRTSWCEHRWEMLLDGRWETTGRRRLIGRRHAGRRLEKLMERPDGV
jgi:hypothetical protein